MNELTLKQVLDFAKSGDIKNLDVCNNYDDMVNFINLVLIELHSRFIINQDIVEVPLEQDKTVYNLLDYIKDWHSSLSLLYFSAEYIDKKRGIKIW